MVVMNVKFTKKNIYYIYVFFSFFLGWECISTENGSALRIQAFDFLADDFDECPSIILFSVLQ